jgi:glycosyltransferase involved in cell wall biosynthesis
MPHIVVYSAIRLHVGGIETALLQLIHAFRVEYRFSFIGPAHPEFVALLQAMGVDYHMAETPRVFSWSAARQLAHLFQIQDADLIHTIEPRGCTVGALAAWMAGKPVIHRNQISPLDYEGLSFWWRSIYRLGEGLLGWWLLDGTIFVSQAVYHRYIYSGLSPRWRSYYIPYGLDQEEFEDLKAQRQSFKLPPGGFLWLFMARFAPQKAPEVILAAAAKLPSHPSWQLWMVGSGPLEADLKQQAAALGLGDSVHFMPALPLPEARRMLASADAYLLPSRYENMPIALLECLHLGIPSIVTPVGDSWQMVGAGPLEAAGLCVPIDNPTQLAAHMERLMTDPHLYAQLQAAGPPRAALYRADTSLKQIQAIFEAHLGR